MKPERLSLLIAAWLFAVTLAPAFARAQTVVLDRARVLSLARARAPGVASATARVGEARALHVGARALAPENPELTLRAGPRVTPQGETLVDFNVALSWPLDISGARASRTGLANAAAEAAEAEVADAQRVAAGQALDLFVRALGANERVRLAAVRVMLDEALLTSARVRRDAGGGSDLDVALATLLHAEGLSLSRAAVGERDALLALLRPTVGLGPEAQVDLVGGLEVAEVPPLDALLARLPQRPDLVHDALAVRAAQADARLQTQLGVALPRLSLQGGRENEYFVQGGVEIPLPIYQRNQTQAAVATARATTREVERASALARADGELRAAYAAYLGAREALDALRRADDAADLAERLAPRAYELGQRDLPSVVVVRRASADARVTRLDAVVALARARVAVELAAGLLR